MRFWRYEAQCLVVHPPRPSEKQGWAGAGRQTEGGRRPRDRSGRHAQSAERW